MNSKLIPLIALILLALCTMPASAWPVYIDVYEDDGYTLQIDEGNYSTYCTEKGSTGYANVIFAWRRVQSGGSYANICNAAGDCTFPVGSTDRGTRSSAEMTADYAAGYIYYDIRPYCAGGTLLSPVFEQYRWNAGSEPLPVASPTGSIACNFPLELPYVINPFDLICSQNETINPAVINQSWSLTQPDASVYTVENTSIIRTLLSDGWYGIDYDVCNSEGCAYYNSTEFINVTTGFIPATGINFWATNYDPVKNAVVKPSNINLQNLTSGGWRNISSTGGTVKFTATDSALTELITAGQTVKLCGYAVGYEETCANVTVPYSGWEYKINLAGTGAVPTAGNATLFVNAINSYTAEGLAGTTITIANTSIPYSKSVLSSDAGIASFVNIAPGTYTITAIKTGYQTATTNWPAPAGVVTNAYIGLLPVGMTPVVTGTGGENLYDENGNPIIGYDLSGNPITAGPTPDPRTNEEKDADMMNLLRDQGPMLIQFFIVCFVVYMIMGMGGRK